MSILEQYFALFYRAYPLAIGILAFYTGYWASKQPMINTRLLRWGVNTPVYAFFGYAYWKTGLKEPAFENMTEGFAQWLIAVSPTPMAAMLVTITVVFGFISFKLGTLTTSLPRAATSHSGLAVVF